MKVLIAIIASFTLGMHAIVHADTYSIFGEWTGTIVSPIDLDGIIYTFAANGDLTVTYTSSLNPNHRSSETGTYQATTNKITMVLGRGTHTRTNAVSYYFQNSTLILVEGGSLIRLGRKK